MGSAIPEDDTSDRDDESTDTSSSAEADTSSKNADEKFCSSCGEVIKKEAAMCPHCGVEQGEDSDGSPGLAAGLSAIGLLFPIAAGAGQIYNGQTGKGIAFTVIQLINAALMFVVIGFVTYPIFGIYTVYDAYKNA